MVDEVATAAVAAVRVVVADKLGLDNQRFVYKMCVNIRKENQNTDQHLYFQIFRRISR